MLERWGRGEYLGVEPGTLTDPPLDGTALSLFERGCAVWELDYGTRTARAVRTPSGDIALRADLAAREAGVWP